MTTTDFAVHAPATPGVGSGDLPAPADPIKAENDLVLGASARPVDDDSKAYEKRQNELYKRDMDDLLAAKHVEMKKKGITLPSDKAEEDKNYEEKLEASADDGVAKEHAKANALAKPREDPYSVYKATELGFREAPKEESEEMKAAEDAQAKEEMDAAKAEIHEKDEANKSPEQKEAEAAAPEAEAAA